jgi:hypothetical protein
MIYVFAACFLLGLSINLSVAGESKETSDKSIGPAIADDAREVKTEIVNTVEVTKDAIVRDAKAMREDFPKSLKETKDAAVKQSREVKEGATKELKKIRDNLANPSMKPKTESR